MPAVAFAVLAVLAAATPSYHDPAGWSLRYPRTMTVESSSSGPGLATFSEVTVASFPQRVAVHVGRTHDGGYVRVAPPRDLDGRFPRDGVAFRMLRIDGGPHPVPTVPDTRFPVKLSSFSTPSRARPIDADGLHYEATVYIGPAASAARRAQLARVIASLTFPRLHPGETVNDETVLQPASRYPVGSFTLVHAPGTVCHGGVKRCRPGSQPFYLVRARNGFYAISSAWEDRGGGYRSACDLRLDRALEQFYCTNSTARWDRVGRVIRRPAGARFAEPLQYAFAKVAWDGHVVLIAGIDQSPPVAR